MSVEWPGLLWTLLLVPVALAAYLVAQRRRSRYTVRFTNLDLLANVVSAKPGWRRHVPPAFYLLALAALLVSLARPQALALVPKEQATVILVMDVSGSITPPTSPRPACCRPSGPRSPSSRTSRRSSGSGSSRSPPPPRP